MKIKIKKDYKFEIEVIRAIRDMRGCGLKESRDLYVNNVSIEVDFIRTKYLKFVEPVNNGRAVVITDGDKSEAIESCHKAGFVNLIILKQI